MSEREHGRGRHGRRLVAATGAGALGAFVALSGSAHGATGPEHAISDPVFATRTTTFPQRNVDAVPTDLGWYAVWAEHRGGGFDIFGGRVGDDGSLPDGAGTVISTGVDNDLSPALNATSPVVAADDDGQLLVAWSDDAPSGGNDVFAARISSTGRVLDPAALTIDADADVDGGPDVVWTGSAFLVVYQHDGTGIDAARVTPEGDVTPLGTVGATLTNPEVAMSGGTALLVGQRGIDNVAGVRLDGTGTPLGGVFDISTPGLPGRQFQPAVTATPGGWLAVWTDERNGTSNVDVYGARISGAGSVLDPNGIPVSDDTGNQDVPRAGAGGSPSLVTWRDFRDGEADLYGAHVSAAGVVVEPDGLGISATADSESPQAVAAAGGSDVAAFYTRGATEAPHGGAIRGFVRTVSAK